MFGRQRIGIDLGTVNTIIGLDRKGIALREPSVVAIHKDNQEIIAYGREALALRGKISENYKIISPLKDGVIANYSLTTQMLSHYIKQALRRSFSKPDLVICVPSNISKLEKKAVMDAVKELGIRRAMIVEEAFAAAIGAGLDINKAKGRLICDIGGGTTDIATISYGEIVENHTSRVGGNRMNEAIQGVVREEHDLAISREAAEHLKIKIGNAYIAEKDIIDSMEISGSDIATGIPRKQEISAKTVKIALDEMIDQILLAIKSVLEVTQPELAVDILENGIVLTGGGALLRNLPQRLEKELKVPVQLSDTPIDCVALGAMKLIDIMQAESKIHERNKG